MKGQRNYFKITLLISILVAIIFPLAMTGRPIDRDTFFLVMALSFSLTWAIYSMIFLGYVFLVEGRHKRNESKRRKEEDPFLLHSIQEWEALREITVERYKDPGMGNPDWN
jgi:hypothetical protein